MFPTDAMRDEFMADLRFVQDLVVSRSPSVVSNESTHFDVEQSRFVLIKILFFRVTERHMTKFSNLSSLISSFLLKSNSNYI